MSRAACAQLAGAALLVICAQLVGAGFEERARRANKPMEAVLMGSQAVLLDYFWFDLLQYFGAYRLGEHDLSGFALRYERLISLDASFHRATIFASTVRATDMADAQGAIAWLRRAEAANPMEWIYPYEQGFIQYLWLGNIEAAEQDFRRAGEKEDVTPGWRHFVARIKELGGDPLVAYEMWREIAQTTEHPKIRETALKNMERLERVLNSRVPPRPGA